MKKLLLSSLIALSMCAVLVGCSSPKTEMEGASSTPSSNSSSTVSNSTKTVKPKNQVTDQTEKFKSDKFGLSMEFPSSWKGKHRVEESESGIDVYFKPKQKADYEDDGWLFSIIKKTDDLDEGMYDSVGLIKYYKKNGITYFIGGPTDVRFSDAHPEFQTFLKMVPEVPEVLKTLK